MSTIPHDLLVATGTIEALLALSYGENGSMTREMAEHMGVSKGTARSRLTELENEGLVRVDAEMRDGSPVAVHCITEDGAAVAEQLDTIVTGLGPHTLTDEQSEE